jgi:hypothetical protein
MQVKTKSFSGMQVKAKIFFRNAGQKKSFSGMQRPMLWFEKIFPPMGILAQNPVVLSQTLILTLGFLIKLTIISPKMAKTAILALTPGQNKFFAVAHCCIQRSLIFCRCASSWRCASTTGSPSRTSAAEAAASSGPCYRWIQKGPLTI